MPRIRCLLTSIAIVLTSVSLAHAQDTDQTPAGLKSFAGRGSIAPYLKGAAKVLSTHPTMAERIKQLPKSRGIDKPRIVIGGPPASKPPVEAPAGEVLTMDSLRQKLGKIGYSPQDVDDVDGFLVQHEYDGNTVNVITGIYVEEGHSYITCIVSAVNVQEQTPPLWVPFVLLDVNLALPPGYGFTVEEDSMILFCVSAMANQNVNDDLLKTLVRDVSQIVVDNLHVWHPSNWDQE